MRFIPNFFAQFNGFVVNLMLRASYLAFVRDQLENGNFSASPIIAQHGMKSRSNLIVNVDETEGKTSISTRQVEIAIHNN
jgi:hypothetical protein